MLVEAGNRQYRQAIRACPHKTPANPSILRIMTGKPRPAEVDILESIWYIRYLEVEDVAFAGPSLYPNSNPIN
ncbi:MAG: hypothetical protein H7312_16850 [Tardiphaga sp.]|nr:hypothetical protein [Tardiphaga sp.]